MVMMIIKLFCCTKPKSVLKETMVSLQPRNALGKRWLAPFSIFPSTKYSVRFYHCFQRKN